LHAAVTVAAIASAASAATAQTQSTIKIGVLHSLSGTMAISETTLKDTILMMVDDLNKKGRVARQEGRSGSRRPRLELAAFCREGARPLVQGKGRGGVWLLDLGIAEIGLAGL
jgi:urea transport system substrate-binding protein